MEGMTLSPCAKRAFESTGDVILDAYVVPCLARVATPPNG